MTHVRATRWVGIHIHFSGSLYGSAGDRAITGIARPLAEKGAAHLGTSGFFFVRYANNGSHIRLRLRAPADNQTDCADLVSFLTAQPEYWAFVSCSEGRRSIVTRSPRHRTRYSIEEVPYYAELNRYGGEYGIQVAERHFESSSAMVLAALPVATCGRSHRLGLATAMFALQLGVLVPEQRKAAAFAAALQRSISAHHPKVHSELVTEWRNAAPMVMDMYRAGVTDATSLPTELGAYVDNVRDTRDALVELHRRALLRFRLKRPGSWDEVLWYLLPSYIHMTNNRLGLTALEEAYVAGIVASSLGVVRDA